MALGEGLRLWSAGYLGMTARSRAPRAGKLVTAGPYAHTRHPLYTGNLLLVTGFAVLSGAGWPWFPAVMAVAVTLLYARHAGREEAVLAAAFPAEHAAYRQEVPRLGWRLRPGRVPGIRDEAPSPGRALRVEALTLNAIFWLCLAVWIRTRWKP
jgi:protein-S-isoprenylcysteine O-methyltransferase Ste14